MKTQSFFNKIYSVVSFSGLFYNNKKESNGNISLNQILTKHNLCTKIKSKKPKNRFPVVAKNPWTYKE